MSLYWKLKELYSINRTNKITQKMIKESTGMMYDFGIIVPKETLWECICNSFKRTVRRIKQKLKNNVFEPTPEKIIDDDFCYDNIHKIFFKNTIGKHFKMNLRFFEYMENGKGIITYKNAIEYFNLMYNTNEIGKRVLKKIKSKKPAHNKR